MVLAASEDGKVELIQVPEGAKIGERLGLQGKEEDYLAYPALAPEKIKKKKVWEGIVPHLKTTEDKRIVSYQGIPVVTTVGPCFAPTVCGGEVR